MVPGVLGTPLDRYPISTADVPRLVPEQHLV